MAFTLVVPFADEIAGWTSMEDILGRFKVTTQEWQAVLTNLGDETMDDL